MGFYGNITNTARTQFQFDRIYANKTEMVKNTAIDGIYAGRYVLVEYDSETNVKVFTRVYINGNSLYTSPNYEGRTRLTRGECEKNTIVYTAENDDISSGQPLKNCVFYVITSDKSTGSTADVSYVVISDAGINSNYYTNYNIDMASTSEKGRGYDSTVWQKTYIDGTEKYIMIAELNSVVPTFDITADAPSMAPITPHFDANSTDIYYKLHWQTPWGFRIAEGQGTNKTQTTNTTKYPSDQEASYTINTYNSNTNTNETSSSGKYNGAIYFNADGFKPEARSYSDLGNIISVSPTGKSGNQYNTHSGNAGEASAQPDMLEFSFILPALGNAVSDLWDIVYGEDRKRDIEWKDALAPTEIASLGGMTRDPKTLAGCINLAHDLIGMIITDKANAEANEEWYNKRYLYKDASGDLYRIAKIQTYEYNDGAVLGTDTGSVEYKFIKLQHYKDQLLTVYDCILLMEERMGVGTGSSDDLTTVAGCIGTMRKLIELFDYKLEKSSPVITGQYGKLMTSSIEEDDWISYSIDGAKKISKVSHKFTKGEDTSPVEDMNNGSDTITTYPITVDKKGHVVASHTTTTTLPYGYKNVVVDAASQSVSDGVSMNGTLSASNTQDTITFKPSNKWVKMEGKNKVVSIGHEVHSFISGEPNKDYGLTSNKSVAQLDSDNSFDVPTFKFDEAGHIIEAATHTVAVPDNFTTITIGSGNNATTSEVPQGGSIVASNLTDKITVDTGNRWLVAVANGTDKKIVFYHAPAGAEVNTTDSANVEPNFGETFNVPVVKYDEMGHISGASIHTVKMPTPSLSAPVATDASVIINAKMDTATGAISLTNDDIGNRLLTGYEVSATADELVATDSINAAFGKLQKQILDKSQECSTVIAEEEARATQAEEALGNQLETTIADYTTQIKQLDNKINQEIKDRTTAIDETLNMEEAATDSQYISAVKQVNGLISVEKATLPDYTERFESIEEKAVSLEDKLYKETETDDEVPGDIVSLKIRVEVLEGEVSTLKDALASANEAIEALKARLDALEDTEEPTPDPEPEE